MKVLVIAAHPDDEVLGVGGAIKRHSAKGDEVVLLMVTEGCTTQYKNQPEKITQKKNELSRVKDILGISNVIYLDYPDMRLDSIPKTEINSAISQVITKEKPEVIYTHFYGDINNDHKVVFEATMVAARPVGEQTVKTIICYPTPSSTEWSAQNVNHMFMPNMYVDITGYLDYKLRAMQQYESELREYPHPRSMQSLSYSARHWGQQVGFEAAEPMMIIRNIVT